MDNWFLIWTVGFMIGWDAVLFQSTFLFGICIGIMIGILSLDVMNLWSEK